MRRMQIKSYLKLSIAIALVTIVLKTAAWWWTDSVSLAADAMESLVNLAGAMFALAMVTIAARPPDADHPFGHHKAEYFSSGFEGVLIFAAAIGIVWTAVLRLLHPQPIESIGIGVALAVVSSALNGGLAFAMMAKAREHRSVALEADARHLYTDVWTTGGVVVGLVLVYFSGWLWLDPLLAIGVALNILREGVRLTWGSVEGLMDSAVEPEVRAQVDQVLARFAQDSIRFDHLVSRRAGQRRFIDMHMHMPPNYTLGRAAALRVDVERALMAEVPGLRASIQLLPTNAEAHFEQLNDTARTP